MNSVLWIKEHIAADVNAKPLKNNKKGTEPPTRPIAVNCAHCFPDIFFNEGHSFASSKTLNKNTATAIFLRKVKTEGSISDTLNLLIKMENPLMTAVARTSSTPFF